MNTQLLFDAVLTVGLALATMGFYRLLREPVIECWRNRRARQADPERQARALDGGHVTQAEMTIACALVRVILFFADAWDAARRGWAGLATRRVCRICRSRLSGPWWGRPRAGGACAACADRVRSRFTAEVEKDLRRQAGKVTPLHKSIPRVSITERKFRSTP